VRGDMGMRVAGSPTSCATTSVRTLGLARDVHVSPSSPLAAVNCPRPPPPDAHVFCRG
jgi:hypothetical protein